ncbi:MAG: toll/interleukin-1 receptor domain-containing protein [Armatimonadetes bacterium]|nr:toll/interleukin-1 receptor domain-containing protein [Armatimonadota bacterium]
MPFKQFERICLDDKIYEVRMRRVGASLAAELPRKKVYSQSGIDRIIAGCVENDRDEVLLTLQKYGVLTKKEHYGCHLCDPSTGQYCFRACDPIPVDVRYEVSGDLENMVQQLSGKNYFISFASADGRPAATQIHSALQAAGIQGFFSDESVQNGSSWKKDILVNLRASSLVLLIESPIYHTRPRCQVERDYAISLGKPTLRIGICDRTKLQDCAEYLNDHLNHANYMTGSSLDLATVLGLDVPAPPVMAARKEACMNLMDSMPPLAGDKIASKLDLTKMLSQGVPAEQRRIELMDLVFGSVNLADAFTLRLDPTIIF